MTDQENAPPQMATLLDGRKVTIRPLAEIDHDAMIAFGRALPEDDWLYLELDFHNPNIISWLVKAHAAKNWRQVVAVDNDVIVGYSNVRLLPGWKNHVGDIHLVVSEDWRHIRLGTLLAQAIIDVAHTLDVVKVIAEMIEEQSSGRVIFERLGFSAEGVLRDHVHDHYGRPHNMLVLGYSLR